MANKPKPKSKRADQTRTPEGRAAYNKRRDEAEARNKAKASKVALGESRAETIARLSRELRAATERANDLVATNERLGRSRLISPEEEAAFRAVSQERDAALAEQNKIALYFRDHFGKEIEDGDHAGCTLAEIVCRYLARYRKLVDAKGTQ